MPILKSSFFIVCLSTIDLFIHISIIVFLALLLMIRLPINNPIAPVYLLAKNYPHKLVGKCHIRKAELVIASFKILLSSPSEPPIINAIELTPFTPSFSILSAKAMESSLVPLMAKEIT